MDQQYQPPVSSDHAFPMGFIVLPAFVGGLLWLVTMLGRFAQM